jgi:hypothetical protein
MLSFSAARSICHRPSEKVFGANIIAKINIFDL